MATATAKKAAKKAAPAKKTAKAAKKAAASKNQAAPIADTAPVAEDAEIVFVGFRIPIEGETELKIGDALLIDSYNEDDGSYNVKRTPKGKAIDTLFREEFRLATEAASEEEIANHGKPGNIPLTAKTAEAIAAVTRTDAEDAAGSTAASGTKDAEGRTVTAKPAKAAKAATSAAPPEPAAPVKLTASVKALVQEHGGLLEAAEHLADRSGATDYQMGGILAKIEETGAFESILDSEGLPKYGKGQVGFTRYVEAHLGLKYRKAKYLSNIYTTCSRLGITETHIKGIGWSKLKEALSVITEANKDDVLAQAKSLGYDDFKAAMKTRMVNGEGKAHGNSKAEQTTFTFRLFNDKAAVAKEALAKAKKALGIEGDDVATASAAFDHILSEWMSMQD